MDEIAKRFDSMEAMIQALSPASHGEGGPLAFPLMDDSPVEAWLACAGDAKRKQWQEGWIARRKSYEQPIETRDFLAIAAYEVDAAKMEKSFGWSSLSMWLNAAQSSRRDSKVAGLDRSAVLELLPKFLETGASIAAFQASHPNALSAVIDLKSADGEPFWEGAIALLNAGWNPNMWDPFSEPKTGSSMQATLRSLSQLGVEKDYGGAEKLFESDRIAARWMEVIHAAQARGFDVDSRSMDGMTALGFCCVYKGYSGEKLALTGDPRIAALMAMGADPSKASRFWLSAMEGDPKSQQAAAAAWESARLAREVAMPALTTKVAARSL